MMKPNVHSAPQADPAPPVPPEAVSAAPEPNAPAPTVHSSGLRGVLIFVVMMVALILLTTLTPLRDFFSIAAIERWARRLGFWGPAAILVIGIVSPLFLAPRWPIAFVSGLLYGVFRGVLLATVASTLGAWLHFYVASHLLGHAAHHMQKRMRVQPLNALPTRRIFVALFMMRVLPVSSFVTTNLLAGALNIRMRVYLPATFLGMIPSSVLYALGGRIALQPERTHVFLAVGLLVFILAGAWIGRRHWLPPKAADLQPQQPPAPTDGLEPGTD